MLIVAIDIMCIVVVIVCTFSSTSMLQLDDMRLPNMTIHVSRMGVATATALALDVLRYGYAWQQHNTQMNKNACCV